MKLQLAMMVGVAVVTVAVAYITLIGLLSAMPYIPSQVR